MPARGIVIRPRPIRLPGQPLRAALQTVRLHLTLTFRVDERLMTVTARAEEILEFWFAETARDAFQIDARMSHWFGDDPVVDQAVRERFAADVEAASGGALEDWAETARGRLALIILIDQFRRNIHRGTRRAYTKDHEVLKLTIHGIERGHDAELLPVERAFFYMPLQHSESLKVQDFAVQTYRALLDSVEPTHEATFQTFLDFAELHRDIVARFGRFPHRNAVLGRQNTAEESVYLGEDAPAFGQ